MNRIPALYMRGGTSKGVFFRDTDLPTDPVVRNALLLRLIGSPDPYQKQSDGMGGATSSTSKVVILSASERADCDIDYLFGAVAINAPLIDWSGNCGNLSAAVGPAALHLGLLASQPEQSSDRCSVRIWQRNIGQKILAHVPLENGVPRETGNFQEDGVAFAGAEIVLEFIEAAPPHAALLPTGNIVDVLRIPGVGEFQASMLTAGNPTVFVAAAALGLRGTELPQEINADCALLERCEAIRAYAAVRMGLAVDSVTATRERPATPKLAWVAPPTTHAVSSGAMLQAEQIDLVARILSMGKLHHAFTGTGAIALAAAAALPGSIVANAMANSRRPMQSGSGSMQLCFGHASGSLKIGATVRQTPHDWQMERAVLSRSARVIMSGWVHCP